MAKLGLKSSPQESTTASVDYLKTPTPFLPSFVEEFHRTLDPFSVGFTDVYKQMQTIMENVTKNAPSYPPYNIKQIDDKKYVIELAVAGFAKQDIEVTMDGNKLLVKGYIVDSGVSSDNYLWKGIAERNFIRTFTLADSIEIKDAELVNGMLKVWLENIVKTQDAVKKITIKDNSDK